jgi:hypothetical protein
MTLDMATGTQQGSQRELHRETRRGMQHRTGPSGWRERRRQRRELAERDRRSALLAELWRIADLLGDAHATIRNGWVQGGWLAYRDAKGREHIVDSVGMHRVAGYEITGACVVGAIVHAGGGPGSARTQVVQRGLDLTWHTLFRGAHEPVGWCPSPALRIARVGDLTRWNDDPHRSADEVAALLDRARNCGLALATHARQAEQSGACSS